MQANPETPGVLEIGPDGLPSAFVIFRKGWNRSTKGDVLFDEVAAQLVMQRFAEYGNDLILDREHDSVNPSALAARSDASDAQGYFRLSIAPDGGLIASRVRYTPEGRDRLTRKSQRYISPFFEVDRESRRVVAVHNVAIVSQPATYHATALVAASKWSKTTMNPDSVKRALDALEAGDTAAATEILKQVIVDLASSGATAAPVEPEPGLESVADGCAPVPGAETPEDKENKAMALALREFTGAADLAGAQAALTDWRAWRAMVDFERAAQDLDKRRTLVSELVRLGAELPATAWAGDPAARQPAQIYLTLSLADLQARVNAFRARPSVRLDPKVETVKLSARDEELARGMSPEQRERFINLRMSRGA